MKPCRYNCGKLCKWVGKDPEVEHDTGWREEDGTPHTYDRCRKILEQIKKDKEIFDNIKKEHGGGLEFFGVEA